MLYCRHSFTAYFPGISEDYNKPVNPKENDRIYQMEQKQRSYERNISHSVDSQVPPTEKMRALLKANPGKIIAIHNHPESSVPSAPDLYAAVNYDFGIVAAHNGVIFKYSVASRVREIPEFSLNYQLDYLQQNIYNEKGELKLDDKELKRILKRLEDIGIKMEVIA